MTRQNTPPVIFDRAAIRRHRDRAAPHVAKVTPVLAEVADRLLDRLDDTTRRFTRALDIGGRGVIAPMLRARGIWTVSTDLSPAMVACNADPDILTPLLAADEERLPFAPGSFDLVVANLSLHGINDLPGALIQIRHALVPDGLFLASLPALGTLSELRVALTAAEAQATDGASPRVAPFPDLRDGAALLQRAGFALPVADAEDITLRYATPMELLADLRAAGESNATSQRSRNVPPRVLFADALARMLAADGSLSCTLRVAMLTGWAPAASQAQPLKPGSAKISLSDFLSDPS